MSFDFSQVDVEPLATKIKAAAATFMVIKRFNSDRPQPAHYRDIDIHADARLFDAWHAAVELGSATFEHTQNGNWVRSSAAADYMSHGKRLDPWNHPFCLLRRDDILLILSAGPGQKGSPTCKDIHVESSELASLPATKLIQSPAGNLVLMMREKSPPRAQ